MAATDERERISSRYKEEKNNWSNLLSKYKAQNTTLAWLRLATFVGAFAIPAFFIETWSPLFFLTWFVLFSGFLFFVYLAHLNTQKRKTAQLYVNLFDKELRILSGNWSDETDGAELINPNHDYSHDLDLFGKGSLFQFINRSATSLGYKKLADKLNSISLDEKDIKEKQDAIKELAYNYNFRESFHVLGQLIEEENKKRKTLNLNNQPDLSFLDGIFRYFVLGFPYLSSFVIILSIVGLITSSSILFLFFGGLTITGQYLRRINYVHNEVSALGRYLSRYSKLISHFEEKRFESAYLKNLKEDLKTNGYSASDIVKQLGKTIQLFDQRLNMLLGAILNGLFLWDLLICIRLKKWYSQHSNDLELWINTLSEVEALNSFACFTYNHPEYTFPQTSSDVILKAEEVGHPLIPEQERINNAFNIDNGKRICVVTGANMAGKSTFLRTVGTNLILAGNGCVVAAKQLSYKPLTFVTNMRAIDNLLKHESYFFAELSRLQMIMERLKEKGELFFILDEILKGTNSHDKTTGSQALIKQLLKYNGTGIIATHDLELEQLSVEHPKEIFNNCFEVTFEGSNLSFDYKLRDGVTQSHNASFLMRKMGLIPTD